MQKVKEIKKPQITKIPNDWKLIHLNEIVEINPETIDKNYSFDDIEYIDIGSVENYQIKKYEYFKLSERPSRAQRIVRKNDIIVSTVRPYLHGFTKIVDSKPSLICSTGFAVLRSKDLRTVDFIFNFIKSPYFESQLNTHMTGLAYPAVTSKIVGNTILGYPKSIIEIEKIGIILSNLDKLIQKTEQIIEQTQRLKKGLMQRLLTKGIGHTQFKKTEIGDIPENWIIKKFGEFSKTYRYPTFYGIKYQSEGIPVLNIGNIDSNSWRLSLNPDDYQKIDKEISTQFKRTIVNEGDLVLAVRGATIGKLALVPKVLSQSNINANLLRISLDKLICNSSYFWLYCQTNRGKDDFRGFVSSTAKETVQAGKLQSWKIPLPPLEEQDNIVKLLESKENLTLLYTQNRKYLEHLKKGLMQQLLTGKVRVKV